MKSCSDDCFMVGGADAVAVSAGGTLRGRPSGRRAPGGRPGPADADGAGCSVAVGDTVGGINASLNIARGSSGGVDPGTAAGLILRGRGGAFGSLGSLAFFGMFGCCEDAAALAVLARARGLFNATALAEGTPAPDVTASLSAPLTLSRASAAGAFTSTID